MPLSPTLSEKMREITKRCERENAYRSAFWSDPRSAARGHEKVQARIRAMFDADYPIRRSS